MINNFLLNFEIYDLITIIYVVAGIASLCGNGETSKKENETSFRRHEATHRNCTGNAEQSTDLNFR